MVLNECFRQYAEDAGVIADRIVVRPNWTHVELPRGDRARIREQLGWRDDIVVLHSGNMGLKQGLENVVGAARLAAKIAPRVRFVLMGDGSQSEELHRLAADVPSLQFLPAASTEDFPDFLAAADILLVNERASALNMSLPSKLTSYFRAGMPVVAAVPLDGGTAAEISRSQGGIVVRPDDCQSLVDGIVALAADGDLRQRLRRAARSYAANQLASAPALAGLTSAVTGALVRQPRAQLRQTG